MISIRKHDLFREIKLAVDFYFKPQDIFLKFRENVLWFDLVTKTLIWRNFCGRNGENEFAEFTAVWK